MPPLIEPFRSQFIAAFLKRKIAKAFEWEKPVLGETIGPSAPDVYQQYEQKRDRVVSIARDWITQIVDEEPTRFGASGHDLEQALELFGDGLDEEIRKVSKLPSAGNGGFGHPAVGPDFVYWGQMPHYRLQEALCLSVGADPKIFSKKMLDDLNRPGGITDNTWPHLVFLMDRKELFERKFGGQYTRYQIKIEDLKNWIDEINLEVHSAFYQELVRRTEKRTVAVVSKVAEQTTAQASKKVDQRTIDALAQLVTAMAVDSYGYVPKSLRSPIPKEVAGILANLGMSMTDETVRKYLRRGEMFISDDWEPPRN